MPKHKQKLVAGLDLGRHAAHFTVVERNAKGDFNTRFAATFDYQAEGILAEDEVAAPLKEWLAASGFAHVPCVIGVPQHSSILQLSDFPPGDTKQLDEMVAYETKQLGGLSDEDFLHDYGQVPPFHVYNNPALIAICRESLVEQRLEKARNLGVQICDVTSDGSALALAAQNLRRRQVRMPRTLDVIIDVGAEASTALLLVQDQVVFAASMPIGVDRFTGATADTPIDPEIESPARAAAEALAREIHQAVDHWRYQREDNDFSINKLLLAGDGATIPGLDLLLESRFEKPVQRLQRDGDGTDHLAPALLTAWGLALTQLVANDSPYQLSLAPPALRNYRLRISQTPFLATAVAIAAVAAAILLVISIFDLNRDIAQLTAVNDRLQECADIAPQVEATRGEARNIEEMLVPFVAFGNRNRDFIRAMKSIGPHQQSEDWLAYLADEPSYRAPMVDYKATVATTVSGPAASPFSLLGDPRASDKEYAGPPPVRTSEIDPSRFYIAAGFTPKFDDEPLRNVRTTVDALNADPESAFGEASVLPTVEAQVRVSIRPWVDTFQMKSFFLMLPRAQPPYDPEALK